MKGFICLVIFWSCVSAPIVSLAAEDVQWREVKGTHFILMRPEGRGLSSAQVLEKAEHYYDEIAELLGISSVARLWLWENRCRIYLYPDQADYRKHTQRPEWSSGFARIDRREIVSYEGSQDFLDNVLPHEMTHLILRDFVGSSNKAIPLWLEEGVAMSREKNPRKEFEDLIGDLVADKKWIPMKDFCSMRTLDGLTRDRAAIFYAQSYSVVRLLLHKSDGKLFSNLCRDLRDGLSLEQALPRNYPLQFPTLDEFEKQWLAFTAV